MLFSLLLHIALWAKKKNESKAKQKNKQTNKQTNKKQNQENETKKATAFGPFSTQVAANFARFAIFPSTNYRNLFSIGFKHRYISFKRKTGNRTDGLTYFISGFASFRIMPQNSLRLFVYLKKFQKRKDRLYLHCHHLFLERHLWDV